TPITFLLAGGSRRMERLDEFDRYATTWLAEHAQALEAAAAPEEFIGGIGPGAPAAPGALFAAGLTRITWPVEYGGQGLPAEAQAVFDRAASGYVLPTPGYAVGLGMCGPTIVAIGTEEQKRRYLRPLLTGDEIWCQLFSEPGAGSDLASIQLS